MYDEAEYIYQEFQKHFREKKEDPMVLYGIGKNTGKLLPKISDYHIVGLMDEKRRKGFIWEKPILDYEDVRLLNVKTIIIIARPAVIGIIYRRISKFCSENDIIVYDVKGNDLSKLYVNQENDIPYFYQRLEILEKEIQKYDIISFDVFDTLIMRKILYPSDIFTMMELNLRKEGDRGVSNFARLRMEAERQLNDENINPTLDEIYDQIQKMSGIGREYRERLSALEISLEMEFLIPRKEVLELFNRIKRKKKIYLISDMYLSKENISKILLKCGYDGYEEIYVSCEKRKKKEEGLFELFIADIKKKGYNERCCLHIGDNYIADIMGAKSAGLDAFHIMSALELLENSSYRELLKADLDFVDHLTIGLLCAKLFHNPFALYGTKGKVQMEMLSDLAYALIAPIVLCFTIWLMQQILNFNCDYVLYPSRDAYLIQMLCQKLCEVQKVDRFPEGKYFYTSRRAVMASGMWDLKDINYVAEFKFYGSISQLFEKRFAITVDKKAENIEVEDRKALKYYIEKYQQKILESSKRERKNYVNYISNIGFSKSNKIAFIDFVAAGRVQNGLEKLIPEKSIQGFYFLKLDPDKGEIDRDISVESFLPSKGAFEADLNVYKYYLFLEIVLTSFEPTFCCISDKGDVCFMEETRSPEHRKTVNEIQKGILEYTEEFARLCPELLMHPVKWNVPDTILGFIGNKYTTLEMQEIKSLMLTDEFFNQAFDVF